MQADNHSLIAYDHSISLYLQDIQVQRTGYSNQLISVHKMLCIPLNAVIGMVYYLQEFNGFSRGADSEDNFLS